MKKVVIIGGGIAGLSAGIYAQKNGFDSEIYEQHDLAGGHCAYWERRNYRIDGSISFLTGVKPGEEMYDVWQELGAFKDEEIYYKDILVTVELGDKVLHWYRDLNKLEQHLISLAPEDAELIKTLVEDIRSFDAIKIPARKSMESMNILDWGRQIKAMAPALKVSNKYRKIDTLTLANQFQNKLIRLAILSFVPAEFQALAFMTTVANVSSQYSGKIYGGAETLVHHLIEQYQALGGKIFYGQAVTEIIVENNRATGIELKGEQAINADFVISACDPHITFDKLLPAAYSSKDYKEIAGDQEVYQTQSITQIFFGIDADLNAYPSYRIGQVRPYFDANGEETDIVAFEHFGEDYLINPDSKKTVIKVGIPTKRYQQWKALERKQYLAEKKVLSDVYKEKLIELFPEADGHIEMVDVSTPLTMERYCGSFEGAYIGLEMSPNLSKQYLSSAVNKVSNIVLATQWTMLVGGLPAAALSGKFSIQKLCKLDGKKFIGVS